eukprot:3936594-Rhodomonas_salina.1
MTPAHFWSLAKRPGASIESRVTSLWISKADLACDHEGLRLSFGLLELPLLDNASRRLCDPVRRLCFRICLRGGRQACHNEAAVVDGPECDVHPVLQQRC